MKRLEDDIIWKSEFDGPVEVSFETKPRTEYQKQLDKIVQRIREKPELLAELMKDASTVRAMTELGILKELKGLE